MDSTYSKSVDIDDDRNDNREIKNSSILMDFDKAQGIKEMEKADNEIKETFIKKAKRMLSLITVEPIIACFIMPSVLAALATQNLYLEKACRVNLAFESHICDALTRRETTNYTAEEEAVQTLVATVTGWKTAIQSSIPCIILIFLGAYSDRVGQRKVCILLPVFGEFLSCMGLMVNTYFFYQLPIEVAALTGGIFPAITGGWFTMFMGIYSYIADITTEEQRTTRLGMVTLFNTIGVPLGSALSGVLLQLIGLYGVFCLCGSLYILSVIYGYFRINEVKRMDSMDNSTKTCWGWLKLFFDIRYVKDTVSVTFKNGPNKRRLKVILLLFVLCVVMGPVYGEMTVMYLFTRLRFNWNEVDFSIFSTFSTCTSILGTLFSVWVFSHTLKLHDGLIGAFACSSKVLGGIVFAFAMKPWQLYMAPIIEIFSGSAIIAMRAMVSKIVKKDEIGKVNSFFALADAMMPLIYAPMYTQVYTATLKTFSGTFFLIGAGLTVPAVVIFAWFYLTNKKWPNISSSNEIDGQVNDVITTTNGIENNAFGTKDK